MSATFDPATATVVVNDASGGVATWRPPFSTTNQVNSYADGLQKVTSLKKKGMIHIGGALGPTASVSSISTGAELPAVQVYDIPYNVPPIFAVVYTDTSGQSKFSYKNDPNNLIQLVTNGSKISPSVTPPSVTPTTPAVTPTTPAVTPPATQTQSNTGFSVLICIFWCISCISCIALFVFMMNKRG